MRAAHRDAIIERGTTWRTSLQLWNPSTTTQAASTLVPGDHVVVKGSIQVVFLNTPLNGSVELRFGSGLWSDPKLTVKAAELFQMAVQASPTAVIAGYEYAGGLVAEIPSFVAEDGTIVLTIDAAATWSLPDGCGQWDCTIQQSSGDFLRVLEGQFSAVPTVSGDAMTSTASGSMVLSQPTHADLVVYRGDSGRFRVTVTTPPPESAPVDVSGATWKCEIRASANAGVLAVLDVVPVTDDSSSVDVVLTAAVSATINANGVWDIEMTLGGEVQTILAGDVIVTRDVSR